jgi:hypothetical protein
MADQRLPIALAFMIIACAHLDLRDDFVRRGFATVLVLLLAVRAFEVHVVWGEIARGTTSFRESVRHIERGSKVLVAYADPDNGDNAREMWLMHAACLAIIERSALVTTAFTVLGKQVMHVRPSYRDRVDTEDGTPPSVNQLLQVASQTDGDEPPYWSRWTRDYDYLYVLFTDASSANPDPNHLVPLYAGDRFMLYQVTGPQAGRSGGSQAEPAVVQAEAVSAATPDASSKKPMAIMRRRTAARDPDLVRPGQIPRVERAVRVSVSPQGHKDVRSRSPRRHVVRS